MKILICNITLFVILPIILSAQSISINESGAVPHSSAILDISASDRGILVPRMNKSERQAINTPANGLMVFDTETESFWWSDGNEWIEISSTNIGLRDRDADTKIEVEQSPDEDKIRMTVNGTEQLHIDQDRVGIGTSNPTQKLTVEGPTASALNIKANGKEMFFGINSSGPTIRTVTEDPITFRTNNTSRMRIMSSGEIGIGQLAPQHRLHVKDNGIGSNEKTIVALLESATSRRPILQFSETGGGISSGMGIEYNGFGSGDDNKLSINAIGGNPLMTIENGGNVGLGTAIPDVQLDIVRADDELVKDQLRISQFGNGNAMARFLTSENGIFGPFQQYVLGIDASDGDKFKIAQSNSISSFNLGTSFSLTPNGLIGLGHGNPSAITHILTKSADDPLKVSITSPNNTKLRVSTNGGTTIGSTVDPPANGLLVSGDLINTTMNGSNTRKVVVKSDGRLIALPELLRKSYTFQNIASSETITLDLEDASIIRSIRVYYIDNNAFNELEIRLERVSHLTETVTEIASFESGIPFADGSIQFEKITGLAESVNNATYNYRVSNIQVPDPLLSAKSIVVEYSY